MAARDTAVEEREQNAAYATPRRRRARDTHSQRWHRQLRGQSPPAQDPQHLPVTLVARPDTHSRRPSDDTAPPRVLSRKPSHTRTRKTFSRVPVYVSKRTKSPRYPVPRCWSGVSCTTAGGGGRTHHPSHAHFPQGTCSEHKPRSVPFFALNTSSSTVLAFSRLISCMKKVLSSSCSTRPYKHATSNQRDHENRRADTQAHAPGGGR